jgi:hypothetical protein
MKKENPKIRVNDRAFSFNRLEWLSDLSGGYDFSVSPTHLIEHCIGLNEDQNEILIKTIDDGNVSVLMYAVKGERHVLNGNVKVFGELWNVIAVHVESDLHEELNYTEYID